jgi:hypothetical protein
MTNKIIALVLILFGTFLFVLNDIIEMREGRRKLPPLSEFDGVTSKGIPDMVVVVPEDRTDSLTTWTSGEKIIHPLEVPFDLPEGVKITVMIKDGVLCVVDPDPCMPVKIPNE